MNDPNLGMISQVKCDYGVTGRPHRVWVVVGQDEDRGADGPPLAVNATEEGAQAAAFRLWRDGVVLCRCPKILEFEVGP